MLRNSNVFEIDIDSCKIYIGYKSICIYAAQWKRARAWTQGLDSWCPHCLVLSSLLGSDLDHTSELPPCGWWGMAMPQRPPTCQKWLSQVWFPLFLQPPNTAGCVGQGPPCPHAAPQGLQHTPQYRAIRALVVAAQALYYHRGLKVRTNGNFILGPQEHQHRAKGRPRAKC